MVLSIVGLIRIEGNAHYAGKRLQAELVLSGSVPATIQRATQFHEFAGMVVGWTRQGDVATVSPLLVQPVAARDWAGSCGDRGWQCAGAGPPILRDRNRRILLTWPGGPCQHGENRSG